MDELLKLIKIISSFLVDAESAESIPGADGIFVFGCRDGRVALRAAELFQKGKAPYIVVTGKGHAEMLPKEFTTEAEYFYSILREQNIPETAIILENKATNTLENITLGMELIKQRFSVPSSLIVCAKPHHLRRARATFAKQFPEITTYGSAYEVADRELVDNPRMLYKTLREIEKLKLYAAKGDIAHIEIPPGILEAHAKAMILYTKLF